MRRREKAESRECVATCRWPIIGVDPSIPVDFRYERRALDSLRRPVHGLETDPAFNETLGEAVQVELDNPLAAIEMTGDPCLPGFPVTIACPGA